MHSRVVSVIQNWDRELVTSLNRGACARGGAQHGLNSETHPALAREWGEQRRRSCSLGETLDFLRGCHRRAPFRFFNGNTFADIGRRLAAVLFAELPPGRLREITSAVAHYIAGVLDREMMVEIVESLSRSVDLKAGDRVKTLRGTRKGRILRLLPDGRVVWQPDGGQSELVALPESLLPVS